MKEQGKFVPHVHSILHNLHVISVRFTTAEANYTTSYLVCLLGSFKENFKAQERNQKLARKKEMHINYNMLRHLKQFTKTAINLLLKKCTDQIIVNCRDVCKTTAGEVIKHTSKGIRKKLLETQTTQKRKDTSAIV